MLGQKMKKVDFELKVEFVYPTTIEAKDPPNVLIPIQRSIQLINLERETRVSARSLSKDQKSLQRALQIPKIQKPSPHRRRKTESSEDS
jgi:hypothetical protein